MDIPHGKSAGRFKVLLTMPRARLWGPSSPVLYHATVTLRSAVDGTLLDTVTDRFGVRTLDIGRALSGADTGVQ
jgi:beta-galactosidase/beta-glucuronidase